MMKMTDADLKAWADRLRLKYGIAYAMDILTTAEEEAHDDAAD